MGRLLFITTVAAAPKLGVFLEADVVVDAAAVDVDVDVDDEKEGKDDDVGLATPPLPLPPPEAATGCPLLPSAGGAGRPKAVDRGQRP